MDCKKPVRLSSGLLVPCGRCLACRIQKRREWTLRCLHELEANNHEAMFVTLTYNDDNIPVGQSLRKLHLQQFFKKLRKLTEKKIRYFAVGEYGDETQRPHYHAIIFGLSFGPKDKNCVMQSWSFCSWDNPTIRKNSFGIAEPDSIRYVAQYIDKKFTGDLAKIEYDDKGREPVFKLSSKGIGRGYIDKYYEEIKENLKLTLNGVNHSLPRYYINRLDLDISSIQKDAEMVQHKRFKKITGVNHITRDSSRDERKAYYTKELEYKRQVQKSRDQHDKNLKSKLNLKRKKL